MKVDSIDLTVGVNLRFWCPDMGNLISRVVGKYYPASDIHVRVNIVCTDIELKTTLVVSGEGCSGQCALDQVDSIAHNVIRRIMAVGRFRTVCGDNYPIDDSVDYTQPDWLRGELRESALAVYDRITGNVHGKVTGKPRGDWVYYKMNVFGATDADGNPAVFEWCTPYISKGCHYENAVPD